MKLSKRKKLRISYCHYCFGPPHLYMVNDDLWIKVGFTSDTIACLDCLESALGRLLVPDDFTDCDANKGLHVAARSRWMVHYQIGYKSPWPLWRVIGRKWSF
jgi:hypothetical protein